jgi:hypothetical protein
MFIFSSFLQVYPNLFIFYFSTLIFQSHVVHSLLPLLPPLNPLPSCYTIAFLDYFASLPLLFLWVVVEQHLPLLLEHSFLKSQVQVFLFELQMVVSQFSFCHLALPIAFAPVLVQV